MKTTKLFMLALFATGCIYAQDIEANQVPSVIINNFKKEFPKASDIEWERQGNQYSVEFEIGFYTDYEAWFNTSGDLIRYAEEISRTDLPQEIKDAINNQYQGYKIDDTIKFIENNIETYSVEIERDHEERNLLFSKNGKLI